MKLNARQLLLLIAISAVYSCVFTWWFGPDLLINGAYAHAATLLIIPAPPSNLDVAWLIIRMTALACLFWVAAAALFARFHRLLILPLYLGIVGPYIISLPVIPLADYKFMEVFSSGIVFMPIWGTATSYCVFLVARLGRRESAAQ